MESCLVQTSSKQTIFPLTYNIKIEWFKEYVFCKQICWHRKTFRIVFVQFLFKGNKTIPNFRGLQLFFAFS